MSTYVRFIDIIAAESLNLWGAVKATVVLKGEGVSGTITLTQDSPFAQVKVSGEVRA